MTAYRAASLPNGSGCHSTGSPALPLDIAARRLGLFDPLGLIKGHFSRAIEKGERVSQSRAKRGERGLWQRRFWEHLVCDEDDWPHSSFHAYLQRGFDTADWAGENVTAIATAGE